MQTERLTDHGADDAEINCRVSAGEAIQRIRGERDEDLVTNAALSFSHAFNDSTRVLDSLLAERARARSRP